MKLIKAYIRHRKAVEVYKELTSAGYCCMTFVECEGTGQYSDKEKDHISDKYPFIDGYKVIKLEILISDEHVDELISLIKKSAKTGYRGDGLIVVSPVEEVYKIRTDEKGILSI